MQVYDIKDKYYLNDYINWIDNVIFEGDEKGLSAIDHSLIIKNLSRCCAIICTLYGDFYIIKESSNNPFMKVKVLECHGVKCKVNFDGKLKLYDIFTFICNNFSYAHDSRFRKHFAIIHEPYHRDLPLITRSGFNMCGAFAATYIPNSFNYSKIEPLLYFIYTEWAHKNVEHYHYILSWLAFPIRNFTKSDACLFIKSKYDNRIIKFMTEFVYGKGNSITINGLDHVISGINEDLEGKLLVSVEEPNIIHRRHYGIFNRLKAYITGSTRRINRYKSNPCYVDNTNNYVISSKYDNIWLEEGDRRYFCVEALDGFIENKRLVDAIDNCFNQECGNMFYTYLRNGFELMNTRYVPVTAYKKQLIDDYVSYDENYDSSSEEEIMLPF